MKTIWWTVAVLLGCLSACEPPPSNEAEQLLGLMGERLDLMQEVARWKWNERRPIDAPLRERQLLDRVESQGGRRGLDRRFVRDFFADQIEAAKVVQRAYFRRWEAERRGRLDEGRSLADLRREIDRLNVELVICLAVFQADLASEAFQRDLKRHSDRALRIPGVPEVPRIAVRSMTRSSDHLAASSRIEKQAVSSVGRCATGS